MSDEWSGGWVGNKYYGPDEQPPVRTESITIGNWKTRRIKGAPTITFECRGEKAYRAGDVVSQDDFDWTANVQRLDFRGVVTDVRVSFLDDDVRQEVTVEILSAATPQPVNAVTPPAVHFPKRSDLLAVIAGYDQISETHAAAKYTSWLMPQLAAFAKDIQAITSGTLLSDLLDSKPHKTEVERAVMVQSQMFATTSGCSLSEAIRAINEVRDRLGLTVLPQKPTKPVDDLPSLGKPGDRRFDFDE